MYGDDSGGQFVDDGKIKMFQLFIGYAEVKFVFLCIYFHFFLSGFR